MNSRFCCIKKKISLLLIICLVAPILSGCWDSYDIGDMDIVLSAFADYKDEEYTVYLELAKSFGDMQSKQGRTDASSIIMGKGATYEEAISMVEATADNKLYTNAIQTLVLGENLVKEEGVSEIVERVRGDQEYRNNIDIFVTTEDIKAMTEVEPNNNVYLGTSLRQTIVSSEEDGQDSTCKFQNIMRMEAAKNVNFLVPMVCLNEKNYIVHGYAIFDGYKMVGAIPIEEKKGLVTVTNPRASFEYKVRDEENIHYFVVEKVKGDVKTNLDETTGIVTFIMDYKFDANYISSEVFQKLNGEHLKEFIPDLQAQIYQNIADELWRSQQEYGIDYLGLYRYFRANYYSEFKNSDWREMYKNAKFEINVNIDLEDVNDQNLEAE
ncbi:MAG: Ger(x)C family spore germination protein [Clostridiales bacterium]|jgi:Ger(x)C family germination protein|nr:Ger(x)C family spore germination protein [Clostridiales bacterium]